MALNLTEIKGLGPKRLKSLQNAGIETVEDLLNTFPYHYEDKTVTGFIDESLEKKLTVKVKVKERGKVRYLERKRSVLIVPVFDQKGTEADLVFFNQPYQIKRFLKDKVFYIYAKGSLKDGRYKFYSPKFAEGNDAKDFFTIDPVYKKFDGIPEAALKKFIHTALEFSELKDFLPLYQRERYDLMDLTEAYRQIHFPESKERLEKAIERIKYNEALRINTGIYWSKSEVQESEIKLENVELVDQLIKSLPFKLTGAQQKVLNEVYKDLNGSHLMNRMIEGDVGSGKTIIAVIVAYLFSLNGLQTAYMAPTEILARQHYENFKKLLEPFGCKIALLTGSVKPKEALEIREKLKSGEIDIVVGTHALIQESTVFYNIGLVITDEQHRFGVKQRGLFGNKGNVHTLVMSATPIPKTLMLTLFGDLDLSVINELPQGRKKVSTYFYTSKKIPKILDFIKGQVSEGHQAFIVCPFVEESEEMKEVSSVNETYEMVKDYFGDSLKVGLLHGKLDQQQKEEEIEKFESGETDVLVATSIIEVGINIPNVSTIVILSADRFGLSQLHQLRGRTGRSDIKSYCFLVSDNVSELNLERMKTIVNCHDGFKIAQKDLMMRGPGEYFGFRQHGFSNVKFIHPYRDREIFKKTKEMIDEIFRSTSKEDMICKDYLIANFNRELSLVSMN